jgi:preprotein translocase subunit SecY
VTILGSIFVGLLAGLSNITTASLVSGIGVLLTVGIVYRLYEELAKAQLLDLHPMLRGFFGEK